MQFPDPVASLLIHIRTDDLTGAAFFHFFPDRILLCPQNFTETLNDCLRIFNLVMDHGNGADGPVGCDHRSISIQDPASGRLNRTFPLMQLFCHLTVMVRPVQHKKHKPPSQPCHTKTQQAKQDGYPLPVMRQERAVVSMLHRQQF